MYIHPSVRRYNPRNPFPSGLLYDPERLVHIPISQQELESFKQALLEYQQSHPNILPITKPKL